MARPFYSKEEDEEKRKHAQTQSAQTPQPSEEELARRREQNVAQQTAKRQRMKKEAQTGTFAPSSLPSDPARKAKGGYHPDDWRQTTKLQINLNDMTDDRVVGIAKRMKTDEERDTFLTQYRSHIGKKTSANYREDVPTLTQLREMVDASRKGGVYADTRAAYKATMSTFDGLIDVDGSAINLNTADVNTVIRAIRATPDKTRRNALADAFETLTKTEGSRFYGVTFDKTNAKTFLDSAQLSQETYDDVVGEFASVFDARPDAAEANRNAYGELIQMIEAETDDPYIRAAYRYALDEAYKSQTASDTLPDLTGWTPPQSETGGEAGEQEEGWLVRLLKKFVPPQEGDAGEPLAQEETKPQENATASEVKPQSAPAPQTTTGPQAAGETQGPAQQEARYPSLEEAMADESYREAYFAAWQEKQAAETQGAAQKKPPTLEDALADEEFAQEYYAKQTAQEESALPPYVHETVGPIQQAQETAPKTPAGSVDLTRDPVRAAAYVRRGEGNLLTQQTQEAFNDLVASSPAAQVIFGLDVGTLAQRMTQEGDARGLELLYAQSRDAMTGGYTAMLGSTLGGYLTRSKLDSFPQSLRDDLEGAILEIAVDAEEAYENGAFSYDPKSETLYDAYIRATPGVLEQVQGVMRTISETGKAAKDAARQAARDEEKTQQELLEQSRSAMQTTSYTREDYDRVLAAAPNMTTREARKDPTYKAMMNEIYDARMAAEESEEGWLNERAQEYVKRMGFDEAQAYFEAAGYKDALMAFEEDILLQDMRIAKLLGYDSLDAMYSKWGGMTLEQLQDRAEAAYNAMGESVTPEDVEAISPKEETLYTGTGEGVGAGKVIAKGAEHGFYQASGDILEGLWATASINKEDSAGHISQVRSSYTKKWGVSLASAMYTRDMLAYADNAPDEAHGQAIREYIASGRDVFRLGINPTENDAVMNLANAADQRANAISEWAQKNLNKTQGTFFEAASATSSTVTMQAVATAVGGVTGSGFIGALMGYGAGTAAREMRSQLEAGMSRKDALVMGWVHGVSDAIANVYMSDRLTDSIARGIGLRAATTQAAQEMGTVGTSRIMLGMAKAFGKQFAVETVKQSIGETVVDPLTEETLWQLMGGTAQAKISGATWMQAIAAGVTSVDMDENIRKMVSEAPENFLYTLPLAVVTGLGSGTGAARSIMPRTKAAVTTLAQTGSPEAAQATMAAMAEELSDPQTAEIVDRALADAAIGENAAAIMMTDPEIAPQVDAGAKAQEQADAHEASRDNSQAAAEAGRQSAIAAQERMNAGEINPELPKQVANGVEAYSKNTQSYTEHERERAQKQAEADALMADASKAALAKAQEEFDAIVEALKGTIQDAKGRQIAQQRMAEIDARIDEIYAIMDEGGMTDALDQEMSDLSVERIALDTAMQATQEEAAQAAQDEAAYAQEEQRVYAQMELEAMQPAFDTLAKTMLYVDDSQKANILSATGLRTLQQVNFRYGFRLTNDPSRGATSLDGSIFEQLSEESGGRIQADTLHPEDDLIEIGEMKKRLRRESQASIGETSHEQYLEDGAHYGTQDPVTQKIASEIYGATGLTVTVAPLAHNVRAIYDRENGRIILSNRIGAGQAQAQAAMHELTHFIEESALYDGYKKAVLEAAYFGDEGGTFRAADEQRIRETYAQSGVGLDEDGVQRELVAQATEKIVSDQSGAIIDRLLGQKRIGLLARLKDMIGQFLERRRAKKEGRLAQYDAIENAYKRLTEAIKARGKWTQGETGSDPTAEMDTAKRRRGETAQGAPGEQMQFALDRDADGQLFVTIEEDILDGLPEKEWAKATKKALQRKFPDGVQVGSAQIRITGKTRGELTESKYTRWLKNNETAMYADKLRAANNADEILWASHDYVNEGLDHPRTDRIVDFARGVVTIEVGGNAYEASVLVGMKDNGEMLLYDLVEMKKTGIKKRKQRTAGRQSAVHDRSVASSDTIVPEGTADVNPQSTQNGVQYALAPNQFGNETAQRMTTIGEEVKDILRGSEHEITRNQDQLDAAWEEVEADGIDAVVSRLLGKAEDWNAQDNVTAALCGVLAQQDGDLTTAAVIFARYDAEGTKQGQALQSRQVALRLTPEGAMGEMIRKANRANEKAGIPEGSFPTGEEEPRTGGETTEGETTRTTPGRVQDVYDAADALKAELSGLPGEVTTNNPWGLPLSDRQMHLIRKYKLTGERLPGVNYNIATRKQRMLAAIIAADPAMQGAGEKALCQQLEAMKRGYAVVTAADLRYTASQIAEFKAIEGVDAIAPTTQAGREALGRAYQAQDNTVQAGFMKKWTSLRFMNMLSAPATAVRNVSSNVLAGGLEGTATRLATVADRVVAKKTGTRTTDAATREERRTANRAFAGEVARTFSDYFVSHVDTGHGRKYDVGGQGRVFQSEFLEAARNLVDFTMQIGDRPFYEQSYAQELAVIKRLGMKKTEMKDGKRVSRPMTEAEMHEEATMRALRRVYQENREIVDMIARMKAQSPGADLFISTIMPFIKTPTNVAMRAMEYSPVGLAATITRGALFGIETDSGLSIGQRNYVMGIGRSLTGTGLLVAGYALAAAGMIGFGRGEEENRNRREVLTSMYEPYGMYIEIDGQKREIDWALPASSAIAAGAQLWRGMDDGEGFGEAMLSATISGLGDQIMDTPMLSGMSDIFRGYDDTEDMLYRLAKTGATSLMNQTFSPSVIRAIAKATDPYVRDTSDENGVMAALNNSVIQYWPGLRQMLPAKTDVTGEKMLQSGYYSWGKETQNAALHMLDSFFTPTATIGEKNDDALFELLDLSYRTGSGSFLPVALVDDDGQMTVLKTLANATKTGESGYTLTLSDEERREANRIYGDILFNGLRGAKHELPSGFTKRHGSVSMDGIRQMMESREWARMTDEEKTEMISDMKAAVRELVTYKAIMGQL